MKTRKEQIAEIERLLAKYDSRLAKSFAEGIAALENDINLAQVTRLIEEGNFAAIPALVNDAAVAAAFVAFTKEMQGAYIAGGTYGEQIANASRIQFSFDVTRPNNAAYYNQYQANRIVQISQEAQKTVTQILAREVPAGTPPAKTARMIRDNIGLTTKQEQAVSNYRAYLSARNLDNPQQREMMRNALNRELRDKRMDGAIRRALESEKPLTQAEIDKRVNAYRRKYIKRRSENIARTESTRLLNGGSYQYWQDAAAQGVVDADQIVRRWIYTKDGRTRDAHVSIPSMNPDGVGLRESFKSPLGQIRFPGDPSASAANVVNCRCTVFTRVEL